MMSRWERVRQKPARNVHEPKQRLSQDSVDDKDDQAIVQRRDRLNVQLPQCIEAIGPYCYFE